MSFVERLLNKRRLLKFVIPFIPYITYSGEKGLKKGLKHFFKDEAIHKIFSSETELLACLVPIGWAYYGDYQSPPKGGGQVIPEWLQHVIRYYKNDIFFKCSVKQVLLENNTVTGVAFEHRGVAKQDQLQICSCRKRC
jgi:prolycopene isomerase